MIKTYIYNCLTEPFVHGINNIKIATQDKSKDPTLSLAERVARFAIGVLQLIPIINYLTLPLDKLLPYREKASVIPPPPPINISDPSDSPPLIDPTSPDPLTLSPPSDPSDDIIVTTQPADESEKPQEPSTNSYWNTAWKIGKYVAIGLAIVTVGVLIGAALAGTGGALGTALQAATPTTQINHPPLPGPAYMDTGDQTIALHRPSIFTPIERTTQTEFSLYDLKKSTTPKEFLKAYSEAKLEASDTSILKTIKEMKKGKLSKEMKKVVRRVENTIQHSSSIDEYVLLGRPENYQNSKISVFTSYTANTPDRLQMSQKVAANQREYSASKGYQYFEYAENLAVEIDPITGHTITWEPYWSKIAAINKLLNGQESHLSDQPEWIVWLDDDAVIGNKEVRIEDVVDYYASSTDNKNIYFFVTQDSMSHQLPGIPLNSAVLFIKNNDWSRKFFKQVWEMRKKQVPGTSYTYGTCPNQSCLHEQQAITDLITQNMNYASHTQIIPPPVIPHTRIIAQRDSDFPIGINTFDRENHIDLNRNNMRLMYDDDAPETRRKPGDFITQCTGLATKGIAIDSKGEPITGKVENLRAKCIDVLLGDIKYIS